MANRKITELTALTGANATDTDVFAIVDVSADETKKMTLGELKEAFDSGSGFVRITGDTMTGDLALSGADVTFGDNDKAIFGDASEFQIYHTAGGVSYITETGVGGLFLQGANVVLENTSGDNYFLGVDGGASTLYYSGAAKLATTSTGIDVTGTVTADGLTVDGVARLQGGSPYLYLDNSSNTGSSRIYFGDADSDITGYFLYDHSSNSLRTGVNGSERMRIDSSGNLLVGTTDNPSSRKFRVYGIAEIDGAGVGLLGFKSSGTSIGSVGQGNYVVSGGPSNGLGIQSEAELVFGTNGTSERMRIDSSGNVGIGTSSPAEELDISADAPSMQLSSTNASGRNYGLQSQNSGKFAFYDGTAGLNRMVIDSSGNVGIGTSSPDANLHVNSSATSQVRIGTTSTVAEPQLLMIDGSNDYFAMQKVDRGMTFKPQGSEAMRIDSSGNVGIGNTSPTQLLTVGDTGTTYSRLQFYASTSGASTIHFGDGTSGADNYSGYLNYAHDSNSMQFATGGSERMRIDSSGNVGIGGSPTVLGGQNYLSVHSPGNSTNIAGVDLYVSGTREASFISYPSNSEALRIAGLTNRDVTFHANNIERMRIDKDGFVGIGITPSDWRTQFDDNALDIGNHSAIYDQWGGATFIANNFYRENNNALIYKTTNDASYISLDGGNISFSNAPSGTAGTSATFTERMRITTDKVQFNVDAKVDADNSHDLGAGGARWKDLYLSGGVYLGGTGSANKLDDYEEGTYTPAVNTEGGTAYTLSTANGYYRKVGSLVHIEVDITFTAEGSGTITLISLPFTPRGNTEIMNGNVTSGSNKRSIQLTHYSGPNVLVRVDDGAAFQNYWTPKTTWAPTNSFRFAGTYIST